ncbi:hypothetical protein [Mycobacterium sp. SMC-4]|uniref:hypothetical protein n=1 Tax=Mycobacterium sp. SMC-4 TaxID=2857059 RepID=UPI003D020771
MVVLLILGGFSALDMTRRLDPIVMNLVGRSSDFWSALAAWVAVLVGIATVAVAGRYAKHQVDEARRTREEQAQPNVVLYSEPNSDVPNILEIVLKNFGTTPAYAVHVDVDPPITSTPNLQTGDQLAAVPIPDMPILAPGQEWRTVWDSAPQRNQHKRQLQQRIGIDGFSDGDVQRLTPTSKHSATVSYSDSRKRRHETPSVLDFDQREGTTWVDIKTVHDLTKMLEKKLSTQNDALAKIYKEVRNFGTEHGGVWIYGSGDDGEREYRRQAAEAQEAENRRIMNLLEARRQGYHPPEQAGETRD